MITQENAYEKLFNTILFKVRHKYYDECIEIADYAYMVNSDRAEDQESEIFRYRSGEKKAEKKQRVKITNPITSIPLSMVYSYLEEVYRTDGIQTKSEHDNKNIKALIDENFENFYQGQSLHEYLHKTLLHLNRYDPNAWVIYSGDIVGNNAAIKIYPTVASCHQAIDFKMDHAGKLEYLTVMYTRKEVAFGKDGMREETFEDYYLYAAGFIIHFAGTDGKFDHGRDYIAEGYVLQEVGDSIFYVQTFYNGTLEVPAIRAGAYPSGYYGMIIAETFVESARPILNDLIGEKSLFDTQKIIHIFPEKNEYVRKCTYENEDGGACDLGRLSISGEQCPECQGSGKLMVTSEQQTKSFPWPDDKDSLVDLSKITHYVERPINIIEFFEGRIDKLISFVKLVVFNQESLSNALVQSRTATELRLEDDKINNKLAPFAQRTAQAWELANRVGYQMYGLNDPVVDMTHPNDYKLKSTLELIKEFEDARNAGQPQHVLWGITLDILRKQHRNDPETVKEIAAFERWKPWRDKSNEEIFYIIQGRATTDPDKVLWENWDKVKREINIKLDGRYFHMMTPETQRAMVMAEVSQIITDVQYIGGNPLIEQPIIGG